MTDEIATEIASIEDTMRTDYRMYHNDPGMQQRYQTLLEAREPAGSPEPRQDTAVDIEIAQIESRIKSAR